jgi:hypothetical protein
MSLPGLLSFQGEEVLDDLGVQAARDALSVKPEVHLEAIRAQGLPPGEEVEGVGVG